MDNEWQDRSLRERLGWYNNEIDSLFDYLVDKEPFDDKKLLSNTEQLLVDIKHHMKQDINTVNTEVKDGREYVDIVKEALSELPAKSSDRSEWFEKLGRANETLFRLL